MLHSYIEFLLAQMYSCIACLSGTLLKKYFQDSFGDGILICFGSNRIGLIEKKRLFCSENICRDPGLCGPRMGT